MRRRFAAALLAASPISKIHFPVKSSCCSEEINIPEGLWPEAAKATQALPGDLLIGPRPNHCTGQVHPWQDKIAPHLEALCEGRTKATKDVLRHSVSTRTA